MNPKQNKKTKFNQTHTNVRDSFNEPEIKKKMGEPKRMKENNPKLVLNNIKKNGKSIYIKIIEQQQQQQFDTYEP